MPNRGVAGVWSAFDLIAQQDWLFCRLESPAESDVLPSWDGVRNQVEIAPAATATSQTMTLLLGAVAGVLSLIVGGIGIMNIMLVERD